ncbi:MAG TPA: hypothetical protein VKE69_13445 [Planctomycetota bacterium]|nr:hypothetical protein [Planctomycetota bacterium]
MARPTPDLLSLLLQQDQTRKEGGAPEGAAAGSPAPPGTEPRPAIPGAPARRAAPPANATDRMRVDLPAPPPAPRTMGELLQVREKPAKEGSAFRFLVYPALAAILAVAVGFAWLRFIPSETQAASPGASPGFLNPTATGNHNAPSGPERASLGSAAPAPGDALVQRKAAETPPSSTAPQQAAGSPPKTNVAEKPITICAFTYDDSEKNLARAKETVKELKARQFPDVRLVRLQSKAGKKHLVIFVGSAETAQDVDLLAVLEKLTKLPGFGPGQAQDRPFASAFFDRRPAGDVIE